MANTDPQVRYATHTWDVDGTVDEFDIGFAGGYLKQSDVYAFSVVVDPDTGLGTDRQEHLVSFVSESGLTARIKVAGLPLAARRLVVYRASERAKLLVQFLNDSVLTKGNLDLSAKQMLFNIQEIVDGLEANNILINEQVQNVIDINKLTQEIYQQVIQILASGGIVSVNPRVWFGTWSVAEDTMGDSDFEMPGADVDGAGFYDTYIDGVGMEPGVDYEVILDPDPTQPATIRFAKSDWPDGTRWFTVLRGYAKPYTGPAPVTTLAYPINRGDLATYFLDKKDAFSVVLLSATDPVTATLKLIPEGPGDKIETGTFMTLVQRGAQVSLVTDPGVNLIVPGGTVAKTRALNSAISLTCLDADANEWLLSGDLAKQE
ncbi:tail fiber protein [Xanthomonas phage vB_Xar_IVIA-DoCa7]|uniref:Tail fiber protein n=1 Tax=Xanthomonas phage vB_Xar_IVIA-DoCa7 TaxID=2975534 RepID=A0A9X9JQW1_9CAUD|nr:tail fiber protein [Xanthomonas phage vB_Xar_IVIA-DoCa7]